MTEIVHKVAQENAWNWTRGAVEIGIYFVQAGDANLIGVNTTGSTVSGSIGVRIGPEDGDIDSSVVAGPVVICVEKVLHVAGHHLGGDKNTAQSDEVRNGSWVSDRQGTFLTGTNSSISKVNTTWVFVEAQK